MDCILRSPIAKQDQVESSCLTGHALKPGCINDCTHNSVCFESRSSRGFQVAVIWPMQARSEEPSLAEWQSEINKQQRELGALQTALPSSVNLGLAVLQLGKVSHKSQDSPLLTLAHGKHAESACTCIMPLQKWSTCSGATTSWWAAKVSAASYM